MTKPTPADKERQRLGREAQIAAHKALHDKYHDELMALIAKERVARGLPIRPQGPTKEELRERIKRQEAKLEKWRKQLGDLGDAA